MLIFTVYKETNKIMKAQFKFKEEVVTTILTDIEELMITQGRRRELTPRLKDKVWIGLKLRGEKVTKSEIKFIKLI